MLALLLLAVGLGLVLAPGWGGRWARRLPADEWCRLCGVLLCVGAGVVELTVVLAGLPVLMRSVGVAGLAHSCQRTLDGLIPQAAVFGWSAAACALALPTLAAIGARQATLAVRCLLAQSAVGNRVPFGRYDVVVLPISAAVAVSASGPTGWIFISDGLAEALTDEQLGAVLGHEAAHLELAHQRWLRVATALEHSVGLVNPVRRSIASWRRALERCADEAAAGSDLNRRRQLRSAILELSMGPAGPGVAAFGAVDTILERVDALLEQPPAPGWNVRVLMYAPVVWAGGIAATGALVWLIETGRCWL